VTDATLPRPGLARRLWTYQGERFPLFKHGVLIAVFAGSAVAYAALLGARPGWPQAAAAAAVVFLLFLQLRVADEHKDYQDDLTYRPERPVPRGLVSLAELRVAAVVAAVVQVAITAAVDPRLLVYLALVWAWMALMTAEFFAPHWLKARPLVYLLSHMAVMPLIALLAFAFGAGDSGPHLSEVTPFLALSVCNGVALEIARKAWGPEDEREGVETYSRLWGPRGTGAAVLLALAGAVAAAVAALYTAGVGLLPWGLLILLGGAAAAAAELLYATRPTGSNARRQETLTGAFVLAGYLLVSILPLGRSWLS
jgi:4-hydroxybenzoate polyprenyltransferase